MKNKIEYRIGMVIFVVLILVFFVSASDVDITVTSSEGSANPVVNYPFDTGQSNEMNPITLIDGYNKISYNHNGDANNKREYDNIAAGGKFIFKNKKLNFSDFTTTKDSEYAFGNQKIKVPKGSHVIFKDNKVTIEVPKDSIIEKPTKIPNSKEEDVKVEYRYKQGEEPSFVKIKDNGKEYEIKKFGSEKFQVNYDGKADAFRVNGKFELSGIRVGEYSQNDETYLFFDGNAHDELIGSYVSFGDKKLIVGASSKEFSSTVQLLPGNGILTVTDKTMLMVQGIGGEKGGHLTIESRDSEGKIPRITSTEGYNLFSGDKALKYVDSYKDKYKGPGLLTKNPIGASGKESIPIQIVTLDKTGSRLGDWDVIIDSYGSVKAGNAQQLESQLTSSSKGLVTSIRTSFHSLTKEEQTKLGTLSVDKQRELVGASAEKLREELKNIPIAVIPPGTKVTPPDTKPGTTPPTTDKDKIKTLLKNNGITISQKSGFNVRTGEIITKDGKTLSGYIIEGQFTTSNNWNKNNNIPQVAIINKDIYVNQKITNSAGTGFNWVKYKTIK